MIFFIRYFVGNMYIYLRKYSNKISDKNCNKRRHFNLFSGLLSEKYQSLISNENLNCQSP